jgi:hypothetical protein
MPPTRTKKYDVWLVALGIFRVLSRDLPFDELEDLLVDF